MISVEKKGQKNTKAALYADQKTVHTIAPTKQGGHVYLPTGRL